MTLSAGTRLGPYEILSSLGAAGWGRCTGRGLRGSAALAPPAGRATGYQDATVKVAVPSHGAPLSSRLCVSLRVQRFPTFSRVTRPWRITPHFSHGTRT